MKDVTVYFNGGTLHYSKVELIIDHGRGMLVLKSNDRMGRRTTVAEFHGNWGYELR